MMGRLLVSMSQADHVCIVIWPAEKRDAGGQIVAGESSRDHNRGNVHQERVNCGRAFLVDKGRVDSIPNERRLMFDRLVYDGIELVVCHDAQQASH